MAPKAKGKPGSPGLLVSCPSDGSPPDCSLLLSALQSESTDQASAVLTSLQQLPVTDATAVHITFHSLVFRQYSHILEGSDNVYVQEALSTSNIPSALLEALHQAQKIAAWEGTPREFLFRSASILSRWRGSVLRSLSAVGSLELCFACIAEWSVVALQPAPLPVEVPATASPVKGKKGAPPPEPPKTIGPPAAALAAAVTWLAAAVQSSHDAASWAASKMAAWYTMLLRHSEPEVLQASCSLLSAFLRLKSMRSALVQVRHCSLHRCLTYQVNSFPVAKGVNVVMGATMTAMHAGSDATMKASIHGYHVRTEA